MKKIFDILKKYIQKTDALYCYVIDVDGFILADMRHIDSPLKLCKKELIKLYSALDEIYNVSKDIIDFGKRTESIIIKYDYYGLLDGVTILIKAISENLIVISFVAKLENISILSQFKKTVDKLSSVFYPRKIPLPTLLN